LARASARVDEKWGFKNKKAPVLCKKYKFKSAEKILSRTPARVDEK
jgi:hypothetical protein